MSFEFRFQTLQTLPGLFTAYAGAGEGASAPANSPGSRYTAALPLFRRESPRSQARDWSTSSHIVSLNRNDIVNRLGAELNQTMYAVPANVGPRTMDYSALYKEERIRSRRHEGLCGTVDDPFWIDLGAAFDTINLRKLGSGVPGVLTDMEDSAYENFASDTVSGFAVNAIAMQIPIEMLTSTGNANVPTRPPQPSVFGPLRHARPTPFADRPT